MKIELAPERLQPCDILLFHHDKFNLFSNAIQFATKGLLEKGQTGYSHIAMYVGGGNQSIIHFTIGGCSKNELSKYLVSGTTMMCRRFPNLTVEKAEGIKYAAYQDIGRPYNYLAYAGYIDLCVRHLWDKKVFELDNPIVGAGEVCSSGPDDWFKWQSLDILPDVGNNSGTPNHYAIAQTLITQFIIHVTKNNQITYDTHRCFA